MATTSRDTGPGQDTTGPATGRPMQIGEAAERVGLSIRTIRHYEEAGLIVPSARSEGTSACTPSPTSTASPRSNG